MPTRRLLSVPLVFILAPITLVTAPALLLLAWILSLHPKLRTLPHLVTFICLFSWLEIIALSKLLWPWIWHRDADLRLAGYYLAQLWWAERLLQIGTWLFNLKFTITGEDAIAGPSAILIARHASVGDNVLPLIFFGAAREAPLRYILKKELTWLPTLDFGGHALPNYFVDRSGLQTDKEIDAVGRLLTEAPEQDSLLIYPEGTRVTANKRDQLRDKPELVPLLDRWPDLLPPRLGGITRLLEVNDRRDVVMLCHSGFEGASSIPDLMNGNWRNQEIRVHFWRIPYKEIGDDHKAFIYQQWDEMQNCVERLKTSLHESA